MGIEKIKRAAIVYPSGNTTAVVFDRLLNSDRKLLNKRIMVAWRQQSTDQPEVEQCCFVTLPRNPEAVARVEMFGGEFCGNAARSVIWLIAKGQDYQGCIEVSGAYQPLEFSVRNGQVTVAMPLPKDKKLARPIIEGTLVQLDGITQLVVTEPKDGQTARQLLTRLLQANKYRLADQPAVGATYYDQASGKAEFCVWVKEVDTIFDETACGSGTCAIGVALAARTKQSTKLNVMQPSGEVIHTEASYGPGTVTASFITGGVTVLYDGVLVLS